MKVKPITCEKHFENFQTSLSELQEVIEEIKLRGKNSQSQQLLHRSFEVTHEMALNTMAEYFRRQGRPPYSGSRDITLDAFDEELIDDGKGWLDMIICRIKATPVYTEDVHNALTENIIKNFVHLFENFEKKMKDALNM